MERDNDHTSKSMPRSYSYAGKYSTENEYIKFHWISEGKSTLMIFERHANLKYKYGNRHFWCKGYYVSTVGCNKNAIKKYIEDQLKEDMMSDQMTLKEYVDPFKG